MVQWTEVDPTHFERYPSPKPAKGRDDLDDALDAVAAGKTVQLTLEDEQKMRGRRMSLGRRAKQRGLGIEMRYRENRLVVRKKSDGTTQESEGAGEPVSEGEGVAAAPKTSRRRKD